MVLGYYAPQLYGKICSQLSNRKITLYFKKLASIGNTLDNPFSDVLHRSGSARSFTNRRLRVALLAGRNLPSEVDRFSQSLRLSAKDKQLQCADDYQARSEDGEPPIGRGFALAPALSFSGIGTHVSLFG